MKRIRNDISCLFAAILLAAVNLDAAFASSPSGLDPVVGIKNLSTLITSIVSAVGGIILLYSVVQLGIAIKKHDPASTSEGLLGIAAGLVIACAPWIVNFIIGG